MSGIKGKSGRRTANEERNFQVLSDITYDYLVNNFHKFKEENKIRIALEIQKRALPNKIEMNSSFTFADMVRKAHLDNEILDMKHDEVNNNYYYEKPNVEKLEENI